MLCASILLTTLGADVTAQCDNTTLIAANDGAATEQFGYAAAVSGNCAVVGAVHDNDNGTWAGSAYVFRRVDDSWVEEHELYASDAVPFQEFGHAVAIDDEVVVVGAWLDDEGGNSAGAAYVYRLVGQDWVQDAKIVAPDAASGDGFGNSVAISGNTLVVGSVGDDDQGTASGSVYVYTHDGTDWVYQTKLLSSDGVAYDAFGHSVAMENDTVVVGAYWNNDMGAQSGSAYVFRFDGDVWMEDVKLLPDDGGSYDNFGVSVDVSGDRVIVGANRWDGAVLDAGAAYVYANADGNWQLQGKLIANNPMAGDQLGFSVGLSGNTAVVGAHMSDNGGTNAGAAHTFLFDGVEWVHDTRLIAAVPTAGEFFGYAVDADNGAVLVGSMKDDANGPQSGSASVRTADAGVDCNGNGIADACDISGGSSIDCNLNGVPDECELDPETDCNDNGLMDSCEILSDPDIDADGNGIIDTCEIIGDFDGDGLVGAFDLSILLDFWGNCQGNCDADLNADGQVGPEDLAILLQNWD